MTTHSQIAQSRNGSDGSSTVLNNRTSLPNHSELAEEYKRLPRGSRGRQVIAGINKRKLRAAYDDLFGDETRINKAMRLWAATFADETWAEIGRG